MIIPTLLILSLGITVIYSSNQTLAIQQVVFGIVGLVLYFTLRTFDYRSLTPVIKYLYIGIFILLLITLFLGFESRGAIRWISIGPFNFQPSEFAKPVIILTLANFWRKNHPTVVNILKSLGITLPIFALIFKQPDLGTSLTVIFIWIVMLLCSNLPFSKFAAMIGMGVVLLPLSWFFLQDYQKQRILSFLSPEMDPQGIGFHVIQSQIAVGSGELLGRGLGRGTQSRLQFLPEFRTDFIFAFIAEELGFVGSVIVLALYAAIFYFFYKILKNSGDRLGELIVIGVASMMFVQITINIGMNVGLLPITGITLPLLSYGGSSLITTLICLGLASSVERFGMKKKKIDTFEL